MDNMDNKVRMFRLLALRGALKLEVMGMGRSRSPSIYSMVKKEFGITGTKRKVLDQLEEIIGGIRG
jgi:hypothetical protein